MRSGERRLLPFVCECGDPNCTEHVPLTRIEYEELPVVEDGLALAPGHGLSGKRRNGRDGDR